MAEATDKIKVLVTERADSPKAQTVETKGTDDNVQLVPTSILKLVLVRATRTMIQSFLSTAGAIQGINFMDGTALPTLHLSVLGAGIAFCLSALQNALELTAHLDKTNPGIRG